MQLKLLVRDLKWLKNRQKRMPLTMHVLRQNIANNENVKNQSSYINAEPEKQTLIQML